MEFDKKYFRWIECWQENRLLLKKEIYIKRLGDNNEKKEIL